MRKIYPYLAALPIALFAIYPPIDARIPMVESKLWVWLVLFAGFLGFCILFLKLNIFIKALSVYTFIACFFSSCPPIAFTSYVVLVACIYYYVLCLKVEDWTPIKNTLQLALLINIILLFMQAIGTDILLNFGLKQNTCSGVVGNWMQMKSYLIILGAFLIAFMKSRRLLYILLSILIVGSTVYFLSHKVYQYFLYARWGVWVKTIELSARFPWFGWGLGTYKAVFPTLGTGRFTLEGAWMMTHNCWLQILFEIGRIGFALAIGLFIRLFIKLLKADIFALMALVIIAFDMAVHFPTRQPHTVLIIIAFMAYAERIIKKEVVWPVR